MESETRWGWIMAGWMVACVVLEGVAWGAGFRPASLADAVERGAARVESRGVGEVTDDAVRKAIRLQRDTLPFWTTLARLGDFVVEPLSLAARAVVVATVFSSLAALTGRPVGFGAALRDGSWAQGFWVLGLAVRVALMVVLRRGDVETSATLALPPGDTPAPLWVALRQLDVFMLLGWFALARGGWRRGQVNLATAGLVGASLWAFESSARIVGSLVVEAGMRLTLVPEWAGR